MTDTPTKICECGAEISRKPGSRGPLPKRCESCRSTASRAGAQRRKRRSRSRAQAGRFSRPSRLSGQWRSPWERIRAELGWPTNVPGWALRDAGHDPRWYDLRHYPREVVAARKYGLPMPDGYDESNRFPGEERRTVWTLRGPVVVGGGAPGAEPDPVEEDPALPAPGREERAVLQEVDDALSGDETLPEVDPGAVALPDDVAALRTADSAPKPHEGDTLPDFEGWVPVDGSKSGGYVDRRSSGKRDLSSLERYVRRFGPDGLGEDDLRALREWLAENGSDLPRGL